MDRKTNRKFNGKRYDLFLQTNSKRNAQNAKKKLKREGYLVRIVDGFGAYKYAVYYREIKGRMYS